MEEAHGLCPDHAGMRSYLTARLKVSLTMPLLFALLLQSSYRYHPVHFDLRLMTYYSHCTNADATASAF